MKTIIKCKDCGKIINENKPHHCLTTFTISDTKGNILVSLKGKYYTPTAKRAIKVAGLDDYKTYNVLSCNCVIEKI